MALLESSHLLLAISPSVSLICSHTTERSRSCAMLGASHALQARDDLMAAARKSPEAKEIRADLEKLKKLEEEADANARALWKKNFIAEKMSTRARYGAMSVSGTRDLEFVRSYSFRHKK